MEIIKHLKNYKAQAIKAGKAAKDPNIKALYYGKTLAYNEIIRKLEGNL